MNSVGLKFRQGYYKDMKKSIVVALTFFLLPQLTHAAVVTSQATGNWNTGATWDGDHHVPTS